MRGGYLDAGLGTEWACVLTDPFCLKEGASFLSFPVRHGTVGPSGGSRISERTGRQPQRWRRQPIISANFPPKLHEHEKNLDLGTRVPGGPPWIRQQGSPLQNTHTTENMTFPPTTYVVGNEISWKDSRKALEMPHRLKCLQIDEFHKIQVPFFLYIDNGFVRSLFYISSVWIVWRDFLDLDHPSYGTPNWIVLWNQRYQVQ